MTSLESSEWTNSATEPVLTFLADHDLAMSYTRIVYNLNKEFEDAPSGATIRRALSSALEVSAVHQPEGALYEVTDKGRAWLEEHTDFDDSSSLTKDLNDTPEILG